MSIEKTRKGRPAEQLQESVLESGLDAIGTLAGLLRTDVERATAATNLSQPMAIALGRLSQLPDQSTVGTLAHSLGCNMGNLSGTLDRLEEGGYIERIVAEADRRARFIRITAKGRKTKEQITKNFRSGRVCSALKQLSLQQLETLTEMIRSLNEAVKAEAVSGG
jgi:DNA-binding MarR family transcriptional regulator